MEFEVIRSKRRSIGIEIKQNKLIIRAPMQATNEEINAAMLKHKAWIEKHLAKAQVQKQALSLVKKLTDSEIKVLADRSMEVILERVKPYAPLIGVTYGRITIRNQRSRWGSCSSKGNLNFNCLLMLAPPEVIDSVVVHELCHRKEMNHSDRFYSEVLRVFPDYWNCHIHGTQPPVQTGKGQRLQRCPYMTTQRLHCANLGFAHIPYAPVRA